MTTFNDHHAVALMRDDLQKLTNSITSVADLIESCDF